MADDKLIEVKDEKDTLLRPLDATVEVDYKYEGEAEPEKVLEEELSRGVIKGEEFPEPEDGKVLEYSEIKVNPSAKEGVYGITAYKAKNVRYVGKKPEKGSVVELEAQRKEPISKEECRENMEKRRVDLYEKLIKIYPPQVKKN